MSLVAILAPVLVGVLALEWRSMRAALDHHLQEDLEVACDMLVLHAGELAWRTEAAQDQGYDAGRRRWVEVYGDDGRIAFLRGMAKEATVRAALGPPSLESGYRTLQTPSGAYIRTLTALRRVGPRPFWIRVARSEDDLREDLRAHVLIFCIGVPLAVLGAALAGYAIAGRALGPLARMAERARYISADRLSERLPVENPRDELGQLALVFNDTFGRLEASFDRLKQFTADVSHQLRTPLTAIRSVGEVGLREPRDPQACREIIGSMLEEADRLTRVVDTLLALSRWESGRASLTSESLDLRALARDIVDQIAIMAEEGQVEVEVCGGEPLMVTADATMARQAVMNVIDNAIKFTRRGGRVRVSSASDVLEHRLVVDDEGPGIAPDLRERVLERFYRVDRQRHDAQGTGLGLAIVHSAMTANRGRILIESNEAGGTRVILAFPRASVVSSPS